MAERDWEYIDSEDTDDTHISRFKNRRTGEIEEVKLTAEESKYLTLGDVVDRLLRQVGESRWQDEFASMLSNMLNNKGPRQRSVSLYPETDQLFAILTISNKKQEIEISGMSKVESITELNNETVIFDENWLLLETSRQRAYLKKGDLWAGGYTLHKILAKINGNTIVLESFGILSTIRAFFRG